MEEISTNVFGKAPQIVTWKPTRISLYTSGHYVTMIGTIEFNLLQTTWKDLTANFIIYQTKIKKN